MEWILITFFSFFSSFFDGQLGAGEWDNLFYMSITWMIYTKNEEKWSKNIYLNCLKLMVQLWSILCYPYSTHRHCLIHTRYPDEKSKRSELLRMLRAGPCSRASGLQRQWAMHVPAIFPSPACCTLVLPTALSTRQVTKAAAKAVVLCHHPCSPSHYNRHTSFAPSAKISQGCRPFHNGLELVAFGIRMEWTRERCIL